MAVIEVLRLPLVGAGGTSPRTANGVDMFLYLCNILPGGPGEVVVSIDCAGIQSHLNQSYVQLAAEVISDGMTCVTCCEQQVVAAGGQDFVGVGEVEVDMDPTTLSGGCEIISGDFIRDVCLG